MNGANGKPFVCNKHSYGNTTLSTHREGGAESVSHLGRPRFQLNGKINKTENDYTILTKFYTRKIEVNKQIIQERPRIQGQKCTT